MGKIDKLNNNNNTLRVQRKHSQQTLLLHTFSNSSMASLALDTAIARNDKIFLFCLFFFFNRKSSRRFCKHFALIYYFAEAILHTYVHMYVGRRAAKLPPHQPASCESIHLSEKYVHIYKHTNACAHFTPTRCSPFAICHSPFTAHCYRPTMTSRILK